MNPQIWDPLNEVRCAQQAHRVTDNCIQEGPDDMTSILTPKTAFKLHVAAATKADSPGGAKIIKPEFETAIEQLGALSNADRLLVKSELEGKSMSQSVARAYRKIIKDATPEGGLTKATETKIREQFESVRGANELGESYSQLPVGPRFVSFTLEDSTCPPNAVCIWAGEKWTAHVPAGPMNAPKDPNEAESFYVGRESLGQTQFYGPFKVNAEKVTHHAPKVESAHFSPGNGLQMMPDSPSPSVGPAIVLKASFYPIDVKPSFEVDVAGKTVTVTCDGTRKKGSPVPRGIMMPKDFRVPFFPPEPGATYTLRVVDREGALLTPSTTFKAIMPV